MTSFQPLHDRILVRRHDATETSKSGLIIPSVARTNSLLADVMAVGPGRIDDSGHLRVPEVKAGDVVVLPKWAGTEINLEVDGDLVPHLVVSEDDILGIASEE